jgi:hypothetical protein
MTEDDRQQLATKADLAELRTGLAELKADLQRFIIIAMGVQTAIFSAIVGAIVGFLQR